MHPLNKLKCTTVWQATFLEFFFLMSFFDCTFVEFHVKFPRKKNEFQQHLSNLNIFELWCLEVFFMDKPPAQAVTGAFTSFQSFSNKASRSSFHSIELLAFKSHKTVRAFEELRSVRFSITKWKRAQRHTQMKPIERRQQQDKSVKETPELGNNLLGVSFNFYCRHCLVYFYFTSVKMIC